MNLDREPSTYTVDELAAELRISRGKVYQELRKGVIPHIAMGRRRVIPRAAVKRWLENVSTRTTEARRYDTQL